MKKILSLMFILLFGVMCLVGCEFTTTGNSTTEDVVVIETNIPEKMEVGKAYTFKCFLSNKEECEFEYSISNEKVAKIEENTITPLKAGKFTITITSSDGKYEEKITVTVTEEEEPPIEDEVYYTVNYYLENQDKTFKKTTKYYKAEKGNLVEAEILEYEGFTFDPTNVNTHLSGSATDELELNVYYTRNSYNIVYMNGTAVYKTVSLKYESAITLALGPNKSGYNFICWQEAGAEFTLNKMPARDIVLDAYFEENTTFKYKTEYYFENLSGEFVIDNSRTTQTTAEKNDVVNAKLISVDGYSHDTANASKVESATINDGTTVLKVYYKLVSYTVSYVVDSATVQTDTYKFGASVTMMAAPTKSGYDFSGWSETLTTMPAQNKTITGFFVKHSESISVSMQLNGGSFAEASNFTITHWRDGMNKVFGINGISLAPKEYQSQASGLYWLKVCLKEVPGQTNVFTIVAVVPKETAITTVTASYTYVLGAYEGDGVPTLQGIVDLNNTTPLYIVIDPIPSTIGEVNVTAHCYDALWKVTGNVNAIDTYALPTPTKDGYNFGGWYANSDFSGSPITVATTSGNVYAKWTSNDVYSACMVASNNGNSTTEGNVISDNGYKISATGFTSNYVVFQVYKNGVAQTMAPSYWTWSSSNESVIATYSNYSCTGAIKGEGTTTITITNVADPTITASFTAIVELKRVKYNVTLYVNNGVCSDLTEYTYGVGATLPVPTRTGFTFGGWYDNNNFQGSAITMISTTDSGNKEFYAKWNYDEDTPNIEALIPSYITSNVNLPSDIGEYEIEWVSSNTKLITFESGNILTVHKGGQTHQNQTITITMKATKAGHTDTYTKTTTVGPVVFDDLDTPVAAYVNSSALYHYVAYDGKDYLFSDKAKAALDIVYYTPLEIHADGTFGVSSSFNNYKAEVLALRETGTRVLVMVGGSASNFKSTCANYVETFATNVVNYVVANGFDGVDLDWEFPMSTAEGLTYTTLMAAIRAKFNAVQQAGGTNYMITSAIPASGFSYERFDWAGLNTYCDYINMMSYDGNKSDTTSHQSPLYKSSYDNGWGNIGVGVDWGVKAFTDKGLAKSKIIIGCACYGKSFTVTGTSTSSYPGLGCAATLCNAGTIGSHDSGTIYYYGIEQLIATGKYTVYTEYNKSGQFVSSYLYSSETKIFVTYETTEMYAQKYAYAKANGLGIMCWSMPEDASDNYINTMYNCKFNH